jgi:protein-tyrosine phosphatase
MYYTMHKILFSWLTLALALTSCSQSTPNITVVCEENAVGNCVVKWEISPALDGYVRVYRSEEPDAAPAPTPIAGAQISEGKLTIVSDNPLKRYYYTVVFNDKYSVKTATRNINICGIQNFRDIGGYKSPKFKKTLRYGMVFRSAKIDRLNCSAEKELRNIGIKTIIDLREPSEKDSTVTDLTWAKWVNAPLNIPNMKDVLEQIEVGSVKKDSINALVTRFNRDILAKENYESYKTILETMLNRENYPMVIQSVSGSGRTAIFLAMLMAAMGVDDDSIAHDYTLSNKYYNIPLGTHKGYFLPTNSQEALTAIYSAKEDFLRAAADEIEQKYGSAEGYLEQVVGLTQEEIKSLQEMLLE